jgi:raffinose/stachyose/melibiose transport system substrate-binding protein
MEDFMSDPLPAGMTRRRLLQLLGAAGIGVVSAACAGPGSSRQDDSAGAPQATGEPEGELSFAHWRAEDKAVFDEIIAAFQTEFPKVTVGQDISPSNDYQSTALQRVKSGNVGDVFTAFRGAQFVNMSKAGLYADLSAQGFVENYDAELIEAGQSDGKQVGLPYQLVFNMPVSNVDLLAKAGASEAPQDWEGFLALCESLKGAGLVPIAFPGGDPGNAGQLLNAMVMNNAPSEDMFTQIETGRAKATDDWFVKTLEQYAQLRPYFQPNSTGTAVEPAQQLFAQQKAAMLATGSFHIAAVRSLGAKFPMDLIAPITTEKGTQPKFVGVHNATFILGANTASKKQAAALKFIEHLSTPEVAGKYANGTGQHVTVKDVTYTNADLKALSPWLEKNTILAPRFQFNDLDIRATVENAAVQVVGGAAPAKAAADAQKIVDQRR